MADTIIKQLNLEEFNTAGKISFAAGMLLLPLINTCLLSIDYSRTRDEDRNKHTSAVILISFVFGFISLFISSMIGNSSNIPLTFLGFSGLILSLAYTSIHITRAMDDPDECRQRKMRLHISATLQVMFLALIFSWITYLVQVSYDESGR